VTVYLDVIWLLNLLFDSLLLYLTALILKRNIQLWRLLAGGFIGSSIILLTFSPLTGIANHPITKLVCSIFMVLTVFGFKRLIFFVKGLMTLYLVTFLLGGTLIGTHYFIQYDREMTSTVLDASVQGFGDPISWLFVLIGFPIAWHFSKKNFEIMEMTKIQYDQIVTVTISICEETFVLKGLVDSGNQLYDPLSRMPVMFVSIQKTLESVSDAVKTLSMDAEKVIMGEAEIPEEWQSRLRVIPCSVVGQERQLIAAVKPDRIEITQNNTEYLCEKGLISFTMQELSADGSFQCIVHPKMLAGPQKNNESEKVS
jgi:stage II sporulation protein GA (sporulation sigma-E factor processing peptidase)